jgi:hypothetical protein
MSWLLREFTSKMTSLDGKLFRSLLALIFQPGRLGAEWLAGRRIRWISPMGLFVVINVIYFIAPPGSDFSLPLSDHLRGQAHSGWALDRVETKFAGVTDWFRGVEGSAKPEGFDSLTRAYNNRSQSLSKTIFIVQVPLVALGLFLLHRKRRIYFVDHFAVALHVWTFLLLSLLVVPAAVDWGIAGCVQMGWFADEAQAGVAWRLALLLVVASYLVITLRRAYGQPWIHAASKAVPVFATIALSHALFRAILFTLTYYSL